MCLMDALVRAVFHERSAAVPPAEPGESGGDPRPPRSQSEDVAIGLQARRRAQEDIDSMVREHARLLEQAELRVQQAREEERPRPHKRRRLH